MMSCIFKNNEKVYLKSKYGMFYSIVIKKIEKDYAFIEGDRFIIGKKKVRVDKLFKEPSKEFMSFSEKVRKEMYMAQEELYKLKDGIN